MIIENPIDISVAKTMGTIPKALRKILIIGQANSMAHFLSQMVLAYQLKEVNYHLGEKDRVLMENLHQIF